MALVEVTVIGEGEDEIVELTLTGEGVDKPVETGLSDLTLVGMPTVFETHLFAPMTVTVVAAGT